MAENIINRPIEEDMKESYVDYAMSVIIGRALPDIRDGLKPVHRRILFTMYQLGNAHNKPHKKSARVVGDCLGKFHPHGDAAIYDSLVRMAQPFSLRYMLVDGHGNMGSIDGDSAAAMRYTEVRMARMSEDILEDIQKKTVDFGDNFDGTLKEPLVLPSRIPNLLVNGSSGIAVGMATNIPPHNLSEVVDAAVALIDGEDEESVVSKVQGPDFPTGGMIVGRSGILKAYKTGRGTIRMRGRAEIDNEKRKITITEIPYQMTKTSLIEKIVDAAKSKRIKGISGINDHSDKSGLSVVIDLKRDANPEIVLNQLYAHTPLESTFGIINLAIVSRQPKLLSMHSMISEFVEFRKEVVRRRSEFELREAEARAHILEGLRIALDNIDEVVTFLKASKDVAAARAGLIEKYSLSEKQANAILDMKLSKLIALEREKIDNEYRELQEKIAWLKDVLSDVKKIFAIIREELLDVKKKYGDERRTEILDVEGEIGIEELIPNKEVVINITHKGYIKRVKLSEYRAQHRGGKGIIGAETHEDDFIRDLIITRNHNYILFFTNKGRAFWLKAYQIPESGRYALGRMIVNILDIKDEKVTSWIAVDEFRENQFLVMATKKGTVKRTALSNFSRPRKSGIIAITLKEGDELIDVVRTNGKNNIFLATKNGNSIRFNETDARDMGRTAQGVRGIKLRKEDEVVAMSTCRKPAILSITKNGYGKRTSVEEYRKQGRGGMGIINIKTEGRNGPVVNAAAVENGDEVIVISSKGQVIRIPVDGISVVGRNTMGVRIIRLKEGEKVASFAVIPSSFNKVEEDKKKENSEMAESGPPEPEEKEPTPES